MPVVAGIGRKLVYACIIVGGSAFYFYDQRTPVEYKSGSVEPAWCDPLRPPPFPEHVTKGGCMTPVIGLLWHRVDCDLKVARVIHDGAGNEIKVPSDNRVSSPPMADAIGHVMISRRTVVVPADAAQSRERGPIPEYRGRMTLSCGALRKVVNPFVIDSGPIPFELKAPEIAPSAK